MSRLPKLPDTWPGAQIEARVAAMNEPVYPVPPDEAGDIRLRLAMFAGRPREAHDTARRIVDTLGLADHCPRAGCRRARRCATRFVVCAVEQRELIRDVLALAREAGG